MKVVHMQRDTTLSECYRSENNGRTIHYENMPMQYIEFSSGLKIENFQQKIFDSFLIFAQNIDCGYTLEPPRRSIFWSPQSMFWSKNKKNS